MGNPLRHFWVSAFKNDVGRPILANSFPKSGTFLLSRCLDLLPDVEPFHKGVYLANRPPMRPSDRYPQLARMPGGSYVSGHLPYSAESAEILSELGFRQMIQSD